MRHYWLTNPNINIHTKHTWKSHSHSHMPLFVSISFKSFNLVGYWHWFFHLFWKLTPWCRWAASAAAVTILECLAVAKALYSIDFCLWSNTQLQGVQNNLPPLSCSTPGKCFAWSFVLIFVGKWEWFADFIMSSLLGLQLSDEVTS